MKALAKKENENFKITKWVKVNFINN
jgi:hypothetical protein